MTISELRKTCQGEKLKRNKGLTRLHRNISIYYTKLSISLGISANCMSVSGILCGIAGSLCLIPGEWQYNLLGVFFLYLSFSSDQVDGELARYYGTVNLNGVYLDELRHLIIYAITIFCLSFPVAQDLDAPIIFLLGFLGAITLVITRVEERLPCQIYTEKVIMNDNFTGGSLAELSAGDSPGIEKKTSLSTSFVGQLKKIISILLYRGFDFLSNQVTILFWIFGVTLIDHFVLFDTKLFGVLSLQSIIFLIFTILGPILLIRTIHGHFQEKKVEFFCRNLMKEKGNYSA